MNLEDWKNVATIIGVSLTFGVAVWGVWVYWRNAGLERAKWLERLYDRFYCDEGLKKVRDLIDDDDKASRAMVSKMVTDQPSEFTDYLNFFEFVAILAARDQLHEDEVRDLFCYYLKSLRENPEIDAYINDETNGFEKLKSLIAKMFS